MTMFFKFNQNSSAQVEAVLGKEDVTLRDLMEEEDTLQECRVQNKKLIDFLVRPEVMEELVTLITSQPPSDMEEKLRYKYSNMACELLMCDVPAINERLAGEADLLGKLHAFLEADVPLDPLLASFWSKTVGVLISRNGDQNWYSYQFTCLQVVEFFKSKANFVSLLLKHLGTSAVMDATLKFITQVEGVDIRQNVLNWLDSQMIVQSLVSLLRPCVDSERQSNAAQLLCSIIRMCPESLQNCMEWRDPDPILSRIESPETVTQLLENMLSGDEKSETSIVGGISVLLALLDCSRLSTCMTEARGGILGVDMTLSEEKQSKVILSTTTAIIPWIKHLHYLLLNPPRKPPVKTTVGVLDPPLGNTRLQVAKLFATLISINNAEVNRELVDLGTVEVLLDLFFDYTWNNFLHYQVEQCLAFALNVELKPPSRDEDIKENVLVESIFSRCKLLQRILEAWDNNEDDKSDIQGRRKGYMGHLVNIANHVVHASEKEPLSSFIKDWVTKDTVAAWEAFIANALAETNKTNDILLAGVHPASVTFDEDAQDYRDIPFPQDSTLSQVFSEYQMNQPSPQFIENYGYRDDQFNDGDEISSPTDNLASMTFTVSEEEIDQQAELFQQVCQKKLGDNNTWNQRRDWDDGADNSSSDEDERLGPDGQESQADADPWVCGEAAEGAGDAPVPVAMDAGNPWASSVPAASCFPAGWANFDSAGFADFEANFNPEGSCDLVAVAADEAPPAAPASPVFTANMPSAPAASVQDDVACSNGNGPEVPGTSPNQPLAEPVSDAAPQNMVPPESSADNANKNQQGEENLQLLDNYRFLSMQGMISEKSAGEGAESLGTPDVCAESNGPVDTPVPACALDDGAKATKCKLEEMRAGESAGPAPATSNGPV